MRLLLLLRTRDTLGQITSLKNMSRKAGRSFTNNFPDFAQGSAVSVDVQRWIRAIETGVHNIYRNMPPLPEHCDGGLYVGNAGVAYMFYQLSKNKCLVAKRNEFLEKANEYLKISLHYIESRRCHDPATSFILGKAGVYAVACAVYKEMGNDKLSDELAQKYAKIASLCKTPGDSLGCGSDELFVGRAGYLCGEQFLRKALGRQVVSDKDIGDISAVIVSSGRDYAKRHRSPCPLMYAYYETEYLGAAHGLSAVLQMLLCYPQYLKSDQEVECDVRAAVDFMLGLEQPNFNYAPALDEISMPRPEPDQLVHWCHGAPGIVYLFAKAYLLWNDEKYLQASIRCGEVTWQKGLLRKGPGICHGVAGSGYVFLLLYRLTNDPKYLDRAQKFAGFMFTPEFSWGARCPDTPYSLYEGWAGTMCFIADLIEPENSAFPFFDVF